MSVGMSSVVKKEWVDALRSGDYAQTTGVLSDGVGFCCLGVLCDLYAKQHPDAGFNVRNSFQIGDIEESGVLPPLVVEWAGLAHSNPSVNVLKSDIYSEYDDIEAAHGDYAIVNLSELNDDYGYNFDTLANVIEEQL